MDLLAAAVLTPCLLPLLVCIACYIKTVSRGPALFVQKRIGHGGRPFRIYKFRTMHVADQSRDEDHRRYVAAHAESDTPIAKPNHGAALIRGGGLLRRLSLDELPQLINIWLGDMSLVGPRPDVLQLEDYTPNQLRRFEVVPGITGLWQVSGKNRLSFDQMIHLDVSYVDQQSALLDIRILAKTLYVMVFDRNE